MDAFFQLRTGNQQHFLATKTRRHEEEGFVAIDVADDPDAAESRQATL
jgi:hypothetical protein